MMAAELCGASPAFAHPYTNEEQDDSQWSQRRSDDVVWAIYPRERL
jgi:hypothetical protein